LAAELNTPTLTSFAARGGGVPSARGGPAPPEAAIAVRATAVGSTVKVKAAVSEVASTSDTLRLQIVLAEESVTFSGENGERFHPMVVRSVAVDAKAAQGFAVAPGKGGSFEYTFDLAKAMTDAKEGLTNYEAKERKGEYTFREKKHEIKNGLVVVAFVQDEATKKVLQATFVKAAGETTTR
jgi:hypothetical protein